MHKSGSVENVTTHTASLIRRVLAVVMLSSTLVMSAGPGTASACSCASGDPVAAAEAADVVFTGSLVRHEGGDTEPVWTFAVDRWVRSGVPGGEMVVQGEDGGSAEAEVIDDGDPEADGGIAWPVVIIGGIVIIAGLVAVRGEYANFRRRRSARRK